MCVDRCHQSQMGINLKMKKKEESNKDTKLKRNGRINENDPLVTQNSTVKKSTVQ